MKRVLLVFLILILVLGLWGCDQQQTDPSGETFPELTATTVTTVFETEETTVPTEPEAEQLLAGIRMTLDGADQTTILSDFNHYTRRWFGSNMALTIESETPFSSLYLIWDRVPGPYTLSWEEGSLKCGSNGFLHEYVQLPEAVYRVSFAFEETQDKVLCDCLLFTAGTTPDWIQLWQPPYDEADILVFPTHSDDDVLFFGPLMVECAVQRRLRVQTAFMVEHHGYPERGHERLNGLWAMGIRNYPILGTAPDTASHDFEEGIRYYSHSKIRQWQVEQIRRFRPLVVIGHDLNGEYGNAGHKVNAFYLVRAVEDAADPEKYPESGERYGIWDTPKLYLHLYRENEIVLDVNMPLSEDPQGRTAFEIAADAMQCHVSQLKWGYRVQQGEHRVYDCRFFGLYRTLVGPDTGADIMENIAWSRWREAK